MYIDYTIIILNVIFYDLGSGPLKWKNLSC